LNEESVLRSLKTVKERVEYLLKKYPETRNDDRYLILLYLRYFTPLSKYINYVPYEVLKQCPSFESIRRVRQYIQNTLGLYPPTKPTAVKRRRVEKAMRGVLGRREL